MTSSEWMMLVLSIYFHDMGLIITEAVLIIKGETTVQLCISAVLLRKAGRWDVPYA